MTDLARAERSRDEDPQNLPQEAGQDLVLVDTTWGELQPLEPVSGVRTVGELEVIALVDHGARLVDTRVPDSRSGRSLPGAVNIPHDEAVDRQDELSAQHVNVLFCNGPQCPQTPDALAALKEAGYPLERLAYYRGGMHDWITLALPTESV